MGEIRILTGMGRQITLRTASYSSVADAKRNVTTVYAVATVASSSNGSPSNAASGSTWRNRSNSNTFRNTVSTGLHQRTGETDVRPAGSDVRVTAGSYAKEN